jgi:hypothetical protein
MPAALSRFTSKLPFRTHFRLAAIVVTTVVLLVASGATILYVYDDAKPTSVTLNVKNGQSEVSTAESLAFTFSRPVEELALEQHLRIQPALDGDLKPGKNAASYSWVPSGPWADLTTYVVTVSTFKDSTGHVVSAAGWRFKTTIVPRIVTVSTSTGTTLSQDSEIPVGETLTIAFNTAMKTSSVTVLANGQPAPLTWAPDAKSAQFLTKGLAVGALQLSLAPGGLDQLGHKLSTDWSFTSELVFRIQVHTVPLRYPALVQIPNDNYGARDQSGWQAADIVFEYLTEGGITRTSALFTNAPDVVGPVRSGRYISFKLTRHYHATNFFSGLSNASMARLNSDPVSTFFDTQGFYYRSHDRLPPNNLYINGSSIQRAEYSLPSFTVPKAAPKLTGGQAASSFGVAEHNSTYAYDAATQTYMKVEDRHTMADAALGQPLRISMVIVLKTHEWVTPEIEDVGGGHARDFDMEAGGSALFYYQGSMYDGRWSGSDRSNPFVFTLSDGRAVSLPIGLVWIDVVSG